MLHRHAIAAFKQAQTATINNAYQAGWEAGVNNYEPDDDPPPGSPSPAQQAAKIGVPVGVAGIVAARSIKYVAPTEPDPATQARATAKALDSLARMTTELEAITPSPAHIAAAQAAVVAGTVAGPMAGEYATGLALLDYLDSNAYRLNGGDSVAWSGEQAGYGEAASADGMLLEWVDENDSDVCQDCSDLASMPAMPLEEWPTTPGAGETECVTGCRCSWDASDDPPQDDYGLTDDQQAAIGRIGDSRMDEATPDVLASAAAPSTFPS